MRISGWSSDECSSDLDEYHFGAWRDAARDLYDPTEKALAEREEPEDSVTDDDLGLSAAHYLYLSGTPFRAITNGEFTEDQIFNWTYIDEQSAKEGWDAANGPNRSEASRVGKECVRQCKCRGWPITKKKKKKVKT